MTEQTLTESICVTHAGGSKGLVFLIQGCLGRLLGRGVGPQAVQEGPSAREGRGQEMPEAAGLKLQHGELQIFRPPGNRKQNCASQDTARGSPHRACEGGRGRRDVGTMEVNTAAPGAAHLPV